MSYSAHQVSRDRIPTATVKLVLQNAKDVKFNLSEVLAGANIPNPGLDKLGNIAPLSRKQFSPIYKQCIAAINEYVVRENDGGFPPTTPEDFDLLCSCVINSFTLEEAIEKTVRFARALNGRCGNIYVNVNDRHASFVMDTHRRHSSAMGLLCDLFGLCFYYKFFSWLIAEPLSNAQVAVSHKAFIDDKIAANIIDCPVAFEATVNSLIFDSKMLQRPVVRTYRELLEVIHISPFELAPSPAPKGIAAILTKLIKKALNEKADLPTSDQIASLLGKSGPTLRRHLARENTSFQAIMDQCRMEKAIELLSNEDLTIDDISFHLGFSAPSGFSRAFKDWTGQAPSTYRLLLKQTNLTAS